MVDGAATGWPWRAAAPETLCAGVAATAAGSDTTVAGGKGEGTLRGAASSAASSCAKASPAAGGPSVAVSAGQGAPRSGLSDALCIPTGGPGPRLLRVVVQQGRSNCRAKRGLGGKLLLLFGKAPAPLPVVDLPEAEIAARRGKRSPIRSSAVHTGAAGWPSSCG
jgi:hypothetical protein